MEVYKATPTPYIVTLLVIVVSITHVCGSSDPSHIAHYESNLTYILPYYTLFILNSSTVTLIYIIICTMHDVNRNRSLINTHLVKCSTNM